MLKTVLKGSLDWVPSEVVARYWQPVLNYHACFEAPPRQVTPVDNITPHLLREHLTSLKRHFTFLTIDEFAEAKTACRIAALTFDDGYQAVLDNAFPICEDLDIPLAVFMITSSLANKLFWRHKVVHIVEQGLSGEFEAYAKSIRKIEGLTLYQYLKHPANCSVDVEAEVDSFWEARRLTLSTGSLMVASENNLKRHPLVTYGNHSHNHYVLSSLNFDQQYAEIHTAHKRLHAIPGIQISRVFSPPFGQTHHVNCDTLTIVRELGYKSILLNRGLLNHMPLERWRSLAVVERFSPSNKPIKSQLNREALRGLAKGLILPKVELDACPPL
jgi:peptidoglycan/xylan/chitin deacetylase (PgdA/CDA1 family)